MSNLSDDDKRTIESVIDAMVQSGWLVASARIGENVAMEMREELVPLIIRLRSLVRAFGDNGITEKQVAIFMQFVCSQPFANDDVS